MTVNVHQAPAAEQRPAIAARKVAAGVVLGTTRPAAIEAHREPLYRIGASEYTAIEDKK